VLAGDADKAEQQMREHLARVRDDLVQLVKRLVLPFSSSGF
jgi:DNA-binding GntR family transcriptional regulator